MSDEGFREIQLNGKQLVFLFMAATVMLVVTFLFGVLVGRGVPGSETVAEMAAGEIAPDRERPAAQESTPPPSAGAAPAEAPAPAETSPPEGITYNERLLRESTPAESLKEKAPAPREPVPPEPRAPAATAPPPPKPAATPAPASTPAPAPTPPPRAAVEKPAAAPTPRGAVEKPAPPPAPATPAAPAGTASTAAAATASNPAGPGFAVQVSIFDSRQEADRLANQLIAKGYPAFVVDPAKGARGIYRVRVGKYRNRKDAEEISVRLEKNEQFKPWIAR